MAVRVINKERLKPEDLSETPVKAAEATKRHHKTREEEADRCLNHTEYSRGSQILVGLIFLAVVFGVPIAQHVVEIRANLAKRAAWKPGSGEPKPGIAPKIYSVVDLLPSREQLDKAKGFWGYWSLIPSHEDIDTFESDLKQTSVLTESLLSPAQDMLTGIFGVGNEKAYVGRDGWLFYRNDVDYLTDDGFLTPKHLTSAAHSRDIQPDPVKAILDFKRQLAARNIELVVMPMPTKPMIHPEMLVGPSAENDRLQNPSFSVFAAELEQNGVPVYDPTPLLLKAKQSGTKQYLETDTHWTPQAMDLVATDVARFIGQRCKLPSIANPGYTLKDVPVSNLGDIAEMLKLPKSQELFKPQSVVTQEVLQPEGTLWTAKNEGDVLLLGDSFSNIFSAGGMNWGSAAGFAEHLSYRLGRPIDEFVKNAGGAFASRQELARAMHHSDRLAGKHVVVYEFSMRDLAQGDWKMIALPAPKIAPPPAPTPIVRKTTPTPPASLTPLVVKSLVPANIDPTKGEIAEIELSVPKGKWQVEVFDPTGKSVAKIGKGEVAADVSVTAKWDGRVDGKSAAAGIYTITATGTRSDGKEIEPVSTEVTVIGAAPVGKIEVLGAAPSTIDPTAKATTTIKFVGPSAGSYSAEVRNANGKFVRKIGTKTTKDGSLAFMWDGMDASGKPAADGAYKVQVRAVDKASKLEPAEAAIAVKAKKLVAPPHPNGDGKGASNTTGSNTKPPVQPVSNELVVTGQIVDRAKDPDVASPYKNALIQIQLTGVHAVSGKIGSGDIAVYVYGMRDHKLVGGVFAKGATVTLKLIPWDKAGNNVTSENQVSLESDVAQNLTTYFGELK